MGSVRKTIRVIVAVAFRCFNIKTVGPHCQSCYMLEFMSSRPKGKKLITAITMKILLEKRQKTCYVNEEVTSEDAWSELITLWKVKIYIYISPGVYSTIYNQLRVFYWADPILLHYVIKTFQDMLSI